MYRLLIVTGNQSLAERLESMQGWGRYDCKQPRIRSGLQDAVECMQKHPIDAIAIQDTVEQKELLDWLDEQRPDMPIFEIVPSEKEQWTIIRELQWLLDHLKADDSNDAYDWDGTLARMRSRFVKKVVAGMVPVRKDIIRKASLYRMSETVNAPCLLARFSIPEDDPFIAERWHYGSDRLEVALHNFFGARHGRMLIHVSVISPEEVRVLCSPLHSSNGLDPKAVEDYLQDTIEQIEHYLGLNLSWIEMRPVSGLGAFAVDDTEN